MTRLWVPERRLFSPVGACGAVIAAPAIVQAAPSWTPYNMTNLVHYWHSVDSTKAGTPGDISQINDLIGTLHLTQATGTSQPDDNTETINGKAVMYFDGGDSMNTTTDPNVNTDGEWYGFIIVKIDTLGDADALLYGGAYSAAVPGASITTRLTGGELELLYANGTNAGSYTAATPVVGTTTPHLVEYWVGAPGGIGVNFAVDGTNAAGATNPTVGVGNPTAAGIMGRGAALNCTVGKFCEGGICNGYPGASDRAALLTYSRSSAGWLTP